MMAAASVPPSRPGLLLTHDWSHLYTPRAFLHTTSTEVDEPYHSLTFPISNALQFHAFVNGLGRCEVDTDKNCPLQLVSGHDSGQPNACPQNPVRAIVKMNYKVTHTLAEAPNDSLLSGDAVNKLQEIERLMVGEGIARDNITKFLKQYGSHFAKGVQRLGKCFSWMVVVDEQFHVNLLKEFAEEIFQICDNNELSIPGSQEGIWYNLHDILDCTGWNARKRRLLQVARLRVTCHDSNKATTTFTEWKQNAHDIRPVNISATSENIVSIWDLIAEPQMKFQSHKTLSSMLQDGWKRLVQESKHHSHSQVSAMSMNVASICDLVAQPQMKVQAQKKLSILQTGWKQSVEERQYHSPSQVSAMRDNTSSKGDPAEQSQMKFQEQKKSSSISQAGWKQSVEERQYHSPSQVSAMRDNTSSKGDPAEQSQRKFQEQKKSSSISQAGWKQSVEERLYHSPSQVSAMRDNTSSKGDPAEQSQMKFQEQKKSSSISQAGWKQSVEERQSHRPSHVSAMSEHHSPLDIKPKSLDLPRARCWGNVLKDLELQDYYPAKITMQQSRALRKEKAGPATKADLPWKILNQLMLVNSKCREEAISKFMKEKKGSESSFEDWISHHKSKHDGEKEDNIPHPMDVTLLVYLCADYMLRQVLAKKLFMCCLAIPFIVPTPDDRVQILLWPLRAIVMEWRTKQKAHEKSLVTSNFNMVAFMRFGQTKKSKSKIMNTVLSNSSHDTFCHKDTQCGNRKRQISNGTVEMSHYLPSSAKSDHFSQPALFFNLRGDACAYPVQHRLLMELATVTVILIDLHELRTAPVKQLLQRTVTTHPKLVLILTDTLGHKDEELDELREILRRLLGDHLKDIKVVSTFENGHDRNGEEVIQHVRECITGKMVQDPPRSLEDFAALNCECPVDEDSHQPCKAGKSLANKISSQLKALDSNERKQKLLPRQGQVLHETGKLLKQLHGSGKKETSLYNKEDIKRQLKAIKEKRIESLDSKAFMPKVFSLYQEQSEVRRFAVKWLQLELDTISRTILPELHSKKNKKWGEMMKAKDAKADCSSFEKDITHLDKQIDAATLGLEHIMREMAQRYDMAADLGQLGTYSESKLSSLPAIAADLLLEGQPLELMDGDHGLIPLHWVKAVFHSLARLVGKKKLFVLSVMGIQSSGKSTLLNAVFGLEFAVSAGRCTKGIYVQLLPVAAESQLPFDYMLVLDSEGLRAQELGQNNYVHDNELATLVIGLSDLALINMKGENVMEITDILQIVVLAFLRMKQADSMKKRKCMFIHQNVSAVNAEERLAVDRQIFQKQLNEMTKQASESQGLHQTVTSFNHVISFDGERDTVYFSDLWHGDPPMAPVNQGYSARAAETQQRILTDIALKNKSFLSIPEFVVRIDDIWKGVLTDDFVFQFRNTLAAKAYLDLERQFGKLTMELEENLLQWVNTSCNAHMLNCHTEEEVQSKCSELKDSLRNQVIQLQTEKLEVLVQFFKIHPSKDIITQWEVEKKHSLQLFGETLTLRMQVKLDNMKSQRSVEVQQQKMSHRKEQDIMVQAIALADQLRGNCPPEAALVKKFHEFWTRWENEIIQATPHQPQNVKQMMDADLKEMLTKEGVHTFLSTESGRTPWDPHILKGIFISQDLTKEHIKARGSHGIIKQVFYKARDIVFNDSGQKEAAVEKANAMMREVTDKIDKISHQDVMFDQHHGKSVIRFALQRVTDYNSQKNIPFSFMPQFQVMFALRAVLYAVPAFERMNQRYEEKHGIHTKLEQLKQRVFKKFQNAVQDASVEVTTADDFCEAIKGPLKDYVVLQIDQPVVKELHQALGITKYDLITKLLDDIAESKNFSSLYSYVKSPVTYAREWVRTFGNRLLFEESKYGQLACTFADDIIRKLRESTQAATRSVLAQESNQYSKWVTKFYSEIEEIIPLDAQRLRVTGTTVIKDFKHFQKCLDRNLGGLVQTLKDDLCAATADSVRWVNNEDPFQRVFRRMWGCQETCPLCSEPCQHTNQDHEAAHACIQHRPPGVRGTKDRHTRLLDIETCNMHVDSTRQFNCAASSFKCRETPHCTGPEDDKEEVYHPYREYKKFLPGWDIAPDPSCEASTFWKWIMCTFQDELVQEYQITYKVAGVEIPDSWKDITEQEARNSLREFFK